MAGLSHWWLLLILVIVLIIFGPGKLPQIGGAIGGAIREFRKSTTEIKNEVTAPAAADSAPVASTATQPEPRPGDTPKA
jgi:sec-independent protein translocase protein TatA